MQQKKPNALSAALAPLWQTVTSENKSKQPSKDDLLTYAQEAFDIDDETHSKLMEEVKEEKVFKTLYPVLLGWAQKSNIWEFKNSIKIEIHHRWNQVVIVNALQLFGDIFLGEAAVIQLGFNDGGFQF